MIVGGRLGKQYPI